MKQNHENVIHDILKQINTPEYNISDVVLNRIKTGAYIKPKRVKRIKRALIIAIIAAVILLMGAAVNMYVIKIFNNDGSSYLQYMPFRRKTFTDEELERLEWQGEFFFGEDSENIVGITFYNDGTIGVNDARKNIQNYDEFTEFIKQTDKNIIKLPQYIPDGYEFYNAYVMFYIDENFDYESAELTERAEKFGNIYEKYYIPENPENIYNIGVSYINTKKTEESINFNIWLHEPESVNTNRSGVETSQLEILQIPQFYYSSLMSTDYTENGKKWTSYDFLATNKIPVKRYLRQGIIVKHFHEADVNKYYDTSAHELGSVHYIILANFLSREEVIKMAESIK